MRIANVNNRALLLVDDSSGLDIAHASAGKFAPEIESVYRDWDAFVRWASTHPTGEITSFADTEVGAPSPSPRQVFAIGLNYRNHAAESGFAEPDTPPVFTKFVSCITGPVTDVPLPEGHVDWEVELVVVVGKGGRNILVEEAWDAVAGFTLGQDISERILQAAGPSPQFSLGKSHDGFGPTGPWLATRDEFANPNAIAIGCTVNGEERQSGSTRDLIFDVPDLVSRLSAVTNLYPGDLIFTGTPEGVGLGRKPQVWLSDGDELLSWGEGLGQLRQRLIAQ